MRQRSARWVEVACVAPGFSSESSGRRLVHRTPRRVPSGECSNAVYQRAELQVVHWQESVELDTLPTQRTLSLRPTQAMD